MLSGLTSMLGPMLGGMFQPGSSAKDQAQTQQDAKYAQFRSGLQNSQQGSPMGIAGLQALAATQVAGQTMAAGEQAMKQKASGWDAFLSGAAQAASNFATGVVSGLQAYRPDNEYSSFAGGFMGATRGLQTAADISEARMRQAAGLEMKAAENVATIEAQKLSAAAERDLYRAAELSKQSVKEEMYRSQADRASIMPGGEGLFRGVRQAVTPQINDLGVAIGQDPMSATGSVMRLLGGRR